MKRIILSILIFGVVLLIGCNQIYTTNTPQFTEIIISTQGIDYQTGTETEITGQTPNPSISPTHSAVELSTRTVTPRATSGEVTISPTGEKSPIIEKCLSPEIDSTTSIVKNGNLFLDWLAEMREGVSVLGSGNLEPNTAFVDVRGHDFYVSPYTSTIAWIDNNGMMRFRKSDGTEYQIKIDEAWGHFRQWLDDDRVIFAPYPTGKQGYFQADDNIYILTPGSSQVENLFFDMPEYLSRGLSANSLPSNPLYDPSFNRVIYAMATYDVDEGMLLWDVKNGDEVWRKLGFGWPTALSGSDWRLNGEEVAIAAPAAGSDFPPELYSLTTDGFLTRLTFLSESVSNVYMIFDISWSPDGRYVAFIFNADINQPLESRILYILDLQGNIVTNYCITPVWDLTWSPNSDQLAFLVNHEQLVILNVESSDAQTIIGLATGLFGWSNWSLP